MIRPATLEDLLTFSVDDALAAAWEMTWTNPHDRDLFERMKPHLVLADDEPIAVIGVNRAVFPGMVLPWVWAVVRPGTAIREGAKRGLLREIRAWLNEHARGRLTRPEKAQEEAYVKLLRVVGFRELDEGLWQWPS